MSILQCALKDSCRINLQFLVRYLTGSLGIAIPRHQILDPEISELNENIYHEITCLHVISCYWKINLIWWVDLTQLLNYGSSIIIGVGTYLRGRGTAGPLLKVGRPK